VAEKFGGSIHKLLCLGSHSAVEMTTFLIASHQIRSKIRLWHNILSKRVARTFSMKKVRTTVYVRATVLYHEI